MGHEYVDQFEPRKIVTDPNSKPDDRIVASGLGAFNRDNDIHTAKEKYDYFCKMMDRHKEAKKKAEEYNREQKSGFEYEGD